MKQDILGIHHQPKLSPHLSDGNGIRASHKQVHNALTNVLLVWPDIVSATLEQVGQERESLDLSALEFHVLSL